MLDNGLIKQLLNNFCLLPLANPISKIVSMTDVIHFMMPLYKKQLQPIVYTHMMHYNRADNYQK